MLSVIVVCLLSYILLMTFFPPILPNPLCMCLCMQDSSSVAQVLVGDRAESVGTNNEAREVPRKVSVH